MPSMPVMVGVHAQLFMSINKNATLGPFQCMSVSLSVCIMHVCVYACMHACVYACRHTY